MALMNDTSFEFVKENYDLNDSDFFQFEDEEEINEFLLDNLSAIGSEVDEGDDGFAEELSTTFNSSSDFSFQPPQSKFLDFLNIELTRSISNLIPFMENNAVKCFPEIREFEKIITGFPQWALSKYNKRYDVIFIDNSINPFLFAQTPVYVHIEYKHKEERNECLTKVRIYLYEILGNNFYLTSDLTAKHSHLFKLVFSNIKGKKNFIIQAKRKFDYLVFQYIKFCTELDPRIYQLGAFLTFWANERKLLDSILTHNTLYLLMIYTLMHTDPPLLPNLFDIITNQDSKEGVGVPIKIKGMKKTDGRYLSKKGIVFLSYEQDKVKIREKTINNPYKGQLGELIFAFFTQCHEMIQPKTVVSITESRLKSYPDNHRQIGFTVIHPFIDIIDMAPNLSRNFNKSLDILQNEVKLAVENLVAKRLKLLCAKKTEN